MDNFADRFLAWLDKIQATPLGQIAQKMGYHVYHSGGGCHHFQKTSLETLRYALVCVEAEIPEVDPGKWDIGIYDDAGELLAERIFEGTLAEALAASDDMLNTVE